VHARQATVLCAGAWSGQLLDRALRCSSYTQLITPLRGHLLHLPAAAVPSMKLAHGMMETAYCAVRALLQA
jgi:glycine/D-amino acid oxidase-like deaminating enzyme